MIKINIKCKLKNTKDCPNNYACCDLTVSDKDFKCEHFNDVEVTKNNLGNLEDGYF